MKMEMLSVQNHIQGQFGVIGTTKVKDWTSPLTAPAAAAAATGVAATALPANEVNVNVANVDIVDVDVVDGHPASVLHMRQHQSLNTRPRLSSSSSTSSAAAAAAAAAVSASVKPPSATMAPNFDIGYMPLPASTPAAACNDVSASAGLELSQQLQEKLREAKSEHLACTEVTLPNDLMQRIAAEIIRMSEREPCGERACTIFIEFESEPNNVRRIASFKVDPDTVSIFELYLTLKQDKSGWTSLLPQFIKNLTRSNTIVISPDFTLTKNKLYSSE